MTTLWQDARYVALARRAAGELGAAFDEVARAILAQWACEIGASHAWPPPRNNPGNVTVGWMTGLGIPYTVPDLATNPQPANPIVTLASADDGADAYAKGLAAFPRYATAVVKARAGDGLAFAEDVCLAGYGTALACVAAAYPTIALPVTPAPPTLAFPGGKLYRLPMAGQSLTLGYSRAPAFRATFTAVNFPGNRYNPWWKITSPGPYAGYYVPRGVLKP